MAEALGYPILPKDLSDGSIAKIDFNQVSTGYLPFTMNSGDYLGSILRSKSWSEIGFVPTLILAGSGSSFTTLPMDGTQYIRIPGYVNNVGNTSEWAANLYADSTGFFVRAYSMRSVSSAVTLYLAYNFIYFALKK